MSLNVPWKQLIHFNDNSVLIKIENICKLIGLYGGCDIMGRYLMDLFDSKIMYRREITFLMNIMLSESKTFLYNLISLTLTYYDYIFFFFFYLGNEECHYSVVKDVIDLYLEHNIWYLPTSASKGSNTSIEDIKKNVVQICLMTEGLAQLVSSLHLTKQGLCLMHCLYPIMERFGSEIAPISLAGNTRKEFKLNLTCM